MHENLTLGKSVVDVRNFEYLAGRVKNPVKDQS